MFAMLRIPVRTTSRSYEAVIEHGLLARAGETLYRVLGRIQPIYIVTVPPVHRRWGRVLVQSLKGAGFAPQIIQMCDGEPFKRLSSVEALAEDLLKLGADRKAAIVAFGGGVVGDVAGMLASVYMRGVKLVQVPTTVQAQLDAAIGGKTGVNLRSGKNLVGTFYQPEVVLIDPAVLSTLPEREFRAGMYEAIKAGVIGNPELFARLGRSSIKSLRKDPELVTWAIAESVKLKARVVSADEKEGGLRRVLNFGHTLGHALETATSYKHFLHGEAVAWGMIAAAKIASEIQFSANGTFDSICDASLAWGRLPNVTLTTSKAMSLIRSDKKTEFGVVNFVLAKEIGKVEVVSNVPERAVAAALAEIRRLSRA
ncbi:MAG TPA: 3-dehydroquinate synthase [Terriglobales bacterium]|nr:3-dehydroquinate synthase [Terriglobales bacterium]